MHRYNCHLFYNNLTPKSVIGICIIHNGFCRTMPYDIIWRGAVWEKAFSYVWNLKRAAEVPVYKQLVDRQPLFGANFAKYRVGRCGAAKELMRVIDRMVSFLVTRRRRAGRLEDRQRAREAEECESRRRLRHLLLYVEWCAAHWAERQLSQQSSASRIPHYTPVERWSTNAVSFVYTCHWRKSFQWLLCPMTARRSHWQYGACNFRTSTRLHRRSCLLSHSGDVGYVER